MRRNFSFLILHFAFSLTLSQPALYITDNNCKDNSDGLSRALSRLLGVCALGLAGNERSDFKKCGRRLSYG